MKKNCVNKSMKMDNSVILGPLIKQKGLNIDLINPDLFEFLPYVQFFKGFQ